MMAPASKPFTLKGKAVLRAQQATPMEGIVSKQRPLSHAFGEVTLPPLRGRIV
jgi:hypothetical protein